jgi:hypothetical protein
MKRFELLWAALLVPLYWVMMAVAAIKAFWQLVATPSFWEKTVHGLIDLTALEDEAASTTRPSGHEVSNSPET